MKMGRLSLSHGHNAGILGVFYINIGKPRCGPSGFSPFPSFLFLLC